MEIGFAGIFTKMLTFIVALLAVHFMQVMYDRTNKVDTKGAFDVVEKDPRAVADYFGWRVLAFCVLAGLIFS
jgi:hypothetical protein